MDTFSSSIYEDCNKCCFKCIVFFFGEEERRIAASKSGTSTTIKCTVKCYASRHQGTQSRALLKPLIELHGLHGTEGLKAAPFMQRDVSPSEGRWDKFQSESGRIPREKDFRYIFFLHVFFFARFLFIYSATARLGKNTSETYSRLFLSDGAPSPLKLPDTIVL